MISPIARRVSLQIVLISHVKSHADTSSAFPQNRRSSRKQQFRIKLPCWRASDRGKGITETCSNSATTCRPSGMASSRWNMVAGVDGIFRVLRRSLLAMLTFLCLKLSFTHARTVPSSSVPENELQCEEAVVGGGWAGVYFAYRRTMSFPPGETLKVRAQRDIGRKPRLRFIV